MIQLLMSQVCAFPIVAAAGGRGGGIAFKKYTESNSAQGEEFFLSLPAPFYRLQGLLGK